MSLYDRLSATPEQRRALAQARLRFQVWDALWEAVGACGGEAEFRRLAGVSKRRLRRVSTERRDLGVTELADWLHAVGFELEVRLVPAGQPRREVLERRAEIEHLRRERDAAIEERDAWHAEADAMVASTAWGKPGVEWAVGYEGDTDLGKPFPYEPVPETDARALHATLRVEGQDAVLLRREHSAWHKTDAKDDDG